MSSKLPHMLHHVCLEEPLGQSNPRCAKWDVDLSQNYTTDFHLKKGSFLEGKWDPENFRKTKVGERLEVGQTDYLPT